MHTGANIAGIIYQPHITSYDYDCPISEAGGIGQPGIGGDNKFTVIPSAVGLEPASFHAMQWIFSPCRRSCIPFWRGAHI